MSQTQQLRQYHVIKAEYFVFNRVIRAFEIIWKVTTLSGSGRISSKMKWQSY